MDFAGADEAGVRRPVLVAPPEMEPCVDVARERFCGGRRGGQGSGGAHAEAAWTSDSGARTGACGDGSGRRGVRILERGQELLQLAARVASRHEYERTGHASDQCLG